MTSRRTNPAYGQISAYLPTDLHRRARSHAVEAGSNLTELLETCLRLFVQDPEFAEYVLGEAKRTPP